MPNQEAWQDNPGSHRAHPTAPLSSRAQPMALPNADHSLWPSTGRKPSQWRHQITKHCQQPSQPGSQDNNPTRPQSSYQPHITVTYSWRPHPTREPCLQGCPTKGHSQLPTRLENPDYSPSQHHNKPAAPLITEHSPRPHATKSDCRT